MQSSVPRSTLWYGMVDVCDGYLYKYRRVLLFLVPPEFSSEEYVAEKYVQDTAIVVAVQCGASSYLRTQLI